jgi:RNA polymerase sigma-70 factor (ECF subfamily)
MSMDEQRGLLRRAKQGDQEAFAQVFTELRPMVYRVAYRIVGPNDADDVVMETYLKAWRALPQFNERAKLTTWLYRITSNCGLDLRRSRQRRLEGELPGTERDDRTIEDFADPQQTSALAAICDQELRALLPKALARLDPLHRTTMLLRYADGLSYAEIAAALDVSLGTVMSRLFNGKRKLRQALAELGETP